MYIGIQINNTWYDDDHGVAWVCEDKIEHPRKSQPKTVIQCFNIFATSQMPLLEIGQMPTLFLNVEVNHAT